jgi:ABC-2 type transport system permease protein
VTYAWVAFYSFRRHAAYPLSAFAEAVTNAVFGIVHASILIALWTARPGLGGYDSTDAVTYTFLAQALIAPVQIFGGIELTERVRTGDVAIDLHRPADLQGWWLADDLGRAGCHLLLRSGLPLAVAALLFPMRWAGPVTLAAFLVSLLLAVLLSFGLRYVVALSVFWLHDDRGVAAIAVVSSMFFSGMIVPLVIFPGGLAEVARALPWAGLVQVPIDVFLGKVSGTGLLGAYGFQLGWALALLAAGRRLTLLAGRKLVIHGG